MSDRMTLDPALLQHVDRQLSALSDRAHEAGARANALAAWSRGAHPALGGAGQTLARAGRTLGDTGKNLDATRREVSRRASLLEQEHASGSHGELSAAKRGDMDTRTRREDAHRDGDSADGLSVLSWFAYLVNTDSDFAFGLGMLHAEMGDTDSREVQKGSSIDVLSVSGETNPDGRMGKVFSAQAMSLVWMLGHNSLGLQSLEGNVGRVQAEATIGKDGATFGGGVSAADVAATFGRPSKDSGTDSQVRLGAGLGVGLTGRLHWSDDDRDGDREYGFGIDLKFVSLDFKTEALDDVVGLALADRGVEQRLESHWKPLNS